MDRIETQTVKRATIVRCNICDTEIDMNGCFRELAVGELTLGAVRCPKCGIVFPSYVLDDQVKSGQRKVSRVAEEIKDIAALAERRLLSNEEKRRYRELLRRYEKLKRENQARSTALMETHRAEFRVLGEVYMG